MLICWYMAAVAVAASTFGAGVMGTCILVDILSIATNDHGCVL